MRFSVLLSVTGIPGHTPYHELNYGDVKRAAESVELAVDESEPGQTEYAYLAREQYHCQFHDGVEWDCRDCPEGCDCAEKATEAYREACEAEHGINPERPPLWWQWGWEAQDLQASGIIDREAFDRLIDDLGAIAEDVQTLGTLGGPANPIGIAPDIDFRIESEGLISTVRVTPLPDRARQSDRPLDEGDWQRVRSAMLSCYGS